MQNSARLCKASTVAEGPRVQTMTSFMAYLASVFMPRIPAIMNSRFVRDCRKGDNTPCAKVHR